MKRVVLPLAVVLVLAGAGFYLQRGLAGHPRQVATWLPAGTILFEDLPDLHRTADRWPATALAQILNEPEVQALLQRPLGLTPHRAGFEGRLARLRRIDPSHLFLAVTDWSGAGAPKAVAGLSYMGSKQDLDALVDELRKRVRESWPEGKGDIEQYGSGEIETFSTPNFSAALAYRGTWLFIATDTALLKASLDRYEGKPAPDSLAELPAFKSSLQHLPQAPDSLFFMRPGLMADKAASLALMLNPVADAQSMDSLRKIDAVGMALKLDGDLMRDAAYVIKSQPDEPGDRAPLARDALKLTTPDTVIVAGERIPGLGDAQLPDTKSDPTGILELLHSYLKTFADQGLGAAQLQQAFGPELGFVLDWPAGAMIPTPLAVVDVKDAALARKFLDTLVTAPIAGISFSRQDAVGISFYSMPPTGIAFFPLQITLGLTGRCLIGALNADAVKQGATRWSAGAAGLGGIALYQKAVGQVAEPTISFTYVDTKAVFERIYGLFRGVASMGFVPHLSGYVDLAKLPAPETISRHLGPMVSSVAVKDGGVLLESAGPVTMTQATLVTMVSALAPLVPLLEAEIKGQSVALPGFPGLSAGQVNPIRNPFANPLNQAPSANIPTPAASSNPGAPVLRSRAIQLPTAPPASPIPSAPSPAASPSAGTP